MLVAVKRLRVAACAVVGLSWPLLLRRAVAVDTARHELAEGRQRLVP